MHRLCSPLMSVTFFTALGCYMPTPKAFAQVTGGFDRWEHRKYATANTGNSKKLVQAADAGDAEAAFEIGNVCLDMLGFHKGDLCRQHADPAVAIFWLHKAAALGYADGEGEAQIGRSLPPTELKEKYTWYKRSADNDDLSGLEGLVIFDRAHPEIVNQDSGADDDILRRLQANASSGNRILVTALAERYLSGDGVSKNKASADSALATLDHGDYRFPELNAAWAEDGIAATYLKAGYGADALAYYSKAAAQPEVYNSHVGHLDSVWQQLALQGMAGIYQKGNGVAADPTTAQHCLELYQQLLAQQNIDEASVEALAAAGRAAQQVSQRAQLSAAIGNLGQAAIALGATSGQASTAPIVALQHTQDSIQTAKDQQLANIQAAGVRTQSTQAKPAAQSQSPFRYNPAPAVMPAPVANTGIAPPPSCVYLGPGNCVPVDQYKQQQGQAANSVNTLCPKTGFVPGVMRRVASDVLEGLPCVPGSVIYINGTPQFSTVGTTYGTGQGYTPTTQASTTDQGGSSPGKSDGSSGSGTPDRLYGQPEDSCVQLSSDAQQRPVFRNTCTATLHVYWTPLHPAPGDFLAFNVYLAPGQTETGAGNIGEYRVYACEQEYLVVGPDGQVITHAVDGFRCVKK